MGVFKLQPKNEANKRYNKGAQHLIGLAKDNAEQEALREMILGNDFVLI